MEEKVNRIMTTEEAAEYLRLTPATVRKFAQSGEIPAAKLGREWRFDKELLEEWFRQQANKRVEPDDERSE